MLLDPPTLPRPPFYTHTMRITQREQVEGGHLKHYTLVQFMHYARLGFWAQKGRTEGHMAEGVAMMLGSLNVKYLATAGLGDLLRIHIVVDNVGRKTCDVHYDVRHAADNTQIATAKTRMVFVNMQHKKSVAVPQDFREWIEGFTQPESAAAPGASFLSSRL